MNSNTTPTPRPDANAADWCPDWCQLPEAPLLPTDAPGEYTRGHMGTLARVETETGPLVVGLMSTDRLVFQDGGVRFTRTEGDPVVLLNDGAVTAEQVAELAHALERAAVVLALYGVE